MKLWLLPVIVVSAFGQKSDVPYAPGSDGPGPTYTSKEVHDVYPGSFSSIRKIDFRNFKYLSFDDTGKVADSFALKKGHYKHDEELGHYKIDLDSIHYLA